MKSRVGLLAFAHALLWVMVNVGWLRVGTEELTGSQLNNTLNLLPAIALIMVFISAYKKLQRSLWLGSGITSGLVALVVVTSDFAKSPAVVKILEGLTGIQNATPADAGLTLTPGVMVWVSVFVSVAALLLSIYSILRPVGQVEVKKTAKVEDNRSLWDEQE